MKRKFEAISLDLEGPRKRRCLAPIPPKPFFEHLHYDIRHIIYSHMAPRPFASAKDYSGLYLSCQFAKAEMDRAGPAAMRSLLLALQKEYASGGAVTLDLPNSLVAQVQPVETAFDMGITVRHSSSFDEDPNTNWDIARELCSRLKGININRFHVRIVETPRKDTSTPHVTIRQEVKRRAGRLFADVFAAPRSDKHSMNAKEMVVFWPKIGSALPQDQVPSSADRGTLWLHLCGEDLD